MLLCARVVDAGKTRPRLPDDPRPWRHARHTRGRCDGPAADDHAERIPAQRHSRERARGQHHDHPCTHAAEPGAPVVRDEAAPESRCPRLLPLPRVRGLTDPDREERDDAREEDHPRAVGLGLHAAEETKRMNCRHSGHERGGRPAQEGDERLREHAAHRAHVEAEAHATQRQRQERRGEEDREEEERDADELALETGTAHGGYRSRSGPSLVIRRSW